MFFFSSLRTSDPTSQAWHSYCPRQINSLSFPLSLSVSLRLSLCLSLSLSPSLSLPFCLSPSLSLSFPLVFLALCSLLFSSPLFMYWTLLCHYPPLSLSLSLSVFLSLSLLPSLIQPLLNVKITVFCFHQD